MTRLEIMTEFGHLLERNKNRHYDRPLLIWKGQRLDITEGVWTKQLCPIICKLKQEQIRDGLSGKEWTSIISTIQKFLKGRE